MKYVFILYINMKCEICVIALQQQSIHIYPYIYIVHAHFDVASCVFILYASVCIFDEQFLKHMIW